MTLSRSSLGPLPWMARGWNPRKLGGSLGNINSRKGGNNPNSQACGVWGEAHLSSSLTLAGVWTGLCRTRPSLWRSEEHTSELQSRENLVCRLLLEKKKKK